MKAKIISLAIAGAIGLSACNSGNASSNTPPSNLLTKATTSKLTATKSASGGGQQQGGISSFLVQSIFGTFAMGTLGFPGTWAASILSSILFSWLPQQEDQTTVMLKEINEKLTVVLDGLKTNLNLTSSIQDITSAVYTLISQQGITDSFSKFDDAITYVNSEYQSYLDNNIFDSNESGDLSSMYQYARQHCEDTAISTILESTGDSKPDNQYKLLKATFINSDSTVGSSSTYQKIVNAKTAYKSAIIATLPKNNDFMKYVNEYNFDITYYRWKTAANFQKIYAMQLAQIAYHYACGKEITFTNLGNLPAASGESGFESGVELLNNKYSSDFKQLESNMETYMPVIGNSEIYTMIDNNFSSVLLGATSFNGKESEVGSCSLSQLYFNSQTNEGKTSGIMNMQAICISGKSGNESDLKYESASIALEIPYHTATNTSIDRIGQFNIKYDTSNKDLSSGISTDSLEDSDISKIFNLRPEMAYNGLYWANKESMNILAPAWIDGTSTRDSAHRYYAGLNVSANNGVQFYTDKYTDNNPATKSEEDYGEFSYGNFVPPYDYQSFSIGSTSLQRYLYTVDGGNKNWGIYQDNPWNLATGWEYWLLANYHGKTFAMKLTFQHVARSSGWFSSASVNGFMSQAIGIFCLSNECSRKDDGTGDNDTKTTLTWTDGTTVTSDNTTADMTGTGGGSYLYRTDITGSVNK